jgi:toxin ParE1/3/4
MASGARWRRLIEAKIFRTNGSSNGSLMGDAQRAFISERRVTLRWSPESIHDLSALRVHILEHDPAAVKPVALHILYCVEHLLSENPQLGHPPAALPEGGSLSFPKTPFVVPYRVRDNVLEISRCITTPAGGRKASNRCRHAASSAVPPVVNIAKFIYIERDMARA